MNYKERILNQIQSKEYVHLNDIKDIPPNVCIDTLEELLQEGYFSVSLLETKCPHCNHWSGHYYEAFWDLPETETCPFCGESFGELLTDNSYLVFKRSKK